MSLEIKGTVVAKLKKVTGEGRNGQWERQEFVISYKSGDYAKEACFQVWGDEKINAIISPLKEGDEVNVFFDFESRKHEDRYFSSGTCWRIVIMKAANMEPAREEVKPESDDLPF